MPWASSALALRGIGWNCGIATEARFFVRQTLQLRPDGRTIDNVGRLTLLGIPGRLFARDDYAQEFMNQFRFNALAWDW